MTTDWIDLTFTADFDQDFPWKCWHKSFGSQAQQFERNLVNMLGSSNLLKSSQQRMRRPCSTWQEPVRTHRDVYWKLSNGCDNIWYIIYNIVYHVSHVTYYINFIYHTSYIIYHFHIYYIIDNILYILYNWCIIGKAYHILNIIYLW